MNILAHASGFSTEGQPIPMRIMRIIDAITLPKEAQNYVAMINHITHIIEHQYRFVNFYHTEQVCHEVLLYLPEYNNFKEIHSSSIWALLEIREKKRRGCEMCEIV